MPHGGLHWAKVGPIIRRRPGNLSPLKGAHLSPNRWSTACGRGYILSPLRGSLGCVKYVDAPVGEGFMLQTRLYVENHTDISCLSVNSLQSESEKGGGPMMMRIVFGMALFSLGVNIPARAQGTRVEPPAVQRHIDSAKALAGTRFTNAMTRQCAPPYARPRPTFADP